MLASFKARAAAAHKTWRGLLAPGLHPPQIGIVKYRDSLSRRTAATAERALETGGTSWRAALALTGPAVIASVAYIDPGNIATNLQAGAGYGYDLLWAVLLANLLAIFIQCLAAKLGIVTGSNLAELSAAYFSRPTVWAMWICSELIAMATDLAEFLGAAIGFALLLNAPLIVGMMITGGATFLILSLEHRGYRPLELVIAGLVAVVAMSFGAEIFISQPLWRATAYHILMPQIPDKGAMILATAIVGATIMPHAIYVHSGLTQKRLVLRTTEQRRRMVRFSNREVISALGVAGLVNLAMLATAAAAFHDRVHNSVLGIEQAYHALQPMLGGGAAFIFMLALIGSGLSSSVVGTMAGQIVMQGFVGFGIPMWLRRAITMLPAFVVAALGMNATHALIISQTVLSLGLPVPMISLLILTANKRVMGEFAATRTTSAIAIGAVTFVLALNATLLLQATGILIA